MRLKSIFISNYKNLNNFSLKFENDDFLDLFVGKNGSGKSNFFEAVLEVFRHLFESNKKQADLGFTYNISYQINDELITVSFAKGEFSINGTKRKTTSSLVLPDNVLIYYSGQNTTVDTLLEKYKNNFKHNVQSATVFDSRKFIGIGPFYKEMLLAIQLLSEETKAKQFIFSKLGIKSSSETVTLTLKRPSFYAAKSTVIEAFDTSTHYWGVEGITLQFLKDLEQCIKGEFNHNDIYFSVGDFYSLPINIDLFKKKLAGIDPATLFRLLDNLHTIGMLDSIQADVLLENDITADISFFSDGQFQSVYIYSITEIFKEQNCITLLDEPDSFLHPEWQFEFLDQITEISEDATLTNHILMTSHSAATLTASKQSELRVFDNLPKKTVVTSVCKEEVLKRLSGNRIALNEKDIVMNITNYLKDSSKPVLFTEGITDEFILDIAWSKLYPGVSRPFSINNAFDRRFLKNLFKRDDLKANYEGRKFFALFDFDDAYDDWYELSKEQTAIIENPMHGLATQLECKDHYAMLLPILENDEVKSLVFNSKGELWAKGTDSHLSIELLFYHESLLETYFERCELPGDGSRIKFSGKKVAFAETFVPSLEMESFEVFRPMFEFIKSACIEMKEESAA